MSTNKEVGTYLARFTEREYALLARARAADVDLTGYGLDDWRTRYGDPELYLDTLRREVEKAERFIQVRT